MTIELQGFHLLLQRWGENPDAPATDISPLTADRDKNRRFTREEVACKVAFLSFQSN